MEEPIENISILPPKRKGEIEFTVPLEITYEDTIGMILLNLPLYDSGITKINLMGKSRDLNIDGSFEIEKNVKPENRERFIEVVKSYIDRDMGKDEGWEIEFNSKYNKIRKINRYINLIKPQK